jgi:hypothetical protein
VSHGGEVAQLYDAAILSSLPWPETEDGLYAKQFLVPFIKNGVNRYIRNVKTSLMVLKVGDILLPITVNDHEYENSYVCSPYGNYVTYPYQVLSGLSNSLIRNGCSFGLSILSKILKSTQFNKVVIVNNWLTSTNLYPKISEDQLLEAISFLQENFKEHAILFRSLDTFQNQSKIELLKKNNFKLIASRYVYFTDPRNEEIFQTRIFKSDLRFLKKSKYEIIESNSIQASDISNILHLYTSIYLEKYSYVNPQLTESFIELALKNKLLHFVGLKSENKIIGIFGYHQRNGVMLSSFFGYDILHPDKGLYRLLCTLMTLEAQKKKLILHQSAGGSFYKKIRKAEGHLEFTAVYDKHLPIKRRLPWVLLKPLVNCIGVPYMRKY